MPDVLIRGMAMPDRRTAELMRTELACVSRECDRHCENCDLVQDRDELIVAFREAIRVLETVANAVLLPEGHGNLIDMDAPVQVKQWTDEATRETTVARLLSKFNIVGGPKIIIQPEGGIKL